MKNTGNKNSNQKTDNKINMILFILLLFLILVAILLSTAWALFSAKQTGESQIRIGKIQVDLKEDWPDKDDPEEGYDDYGLERYTKKVKGQSVGDLPAYVRIRCIPVVEYYNPDNEEWIIAPVSQDSITVTINGENWIYQDEYYYYKDIVEAYGETGELEIGWKIDEIPSEIADKNIRTDVRVILEYAQTTNDAWKTIFQIEQLPEGVEVME